MGSTSLEYSVDDVILDGTMPPDEAPPELRAVAVLLEGARPGPAAGPLANEAETVEAMREILAHRPVHLGERRNRRRLERASVRAGIAAAALVLSAGSAAAANGSLPAPAQRVVASALERVGVHVPKPDTPDKSKVGVGDQGSDTDRPPSNPSKTAPPDAATFGLCTATESGGSPPPVDCTSVDKPGKPESIPPGSSGSPASPGPPGGSPPGSTAPNPPGPPADAGTPAPQASPKASAATAPRDPATPPSTDPSHPTPPPSPPGRAR